MPPKRARNYPSIVGGRRVASKRVLHQVWLQLGIKSASCIEIWGSTRMTTQYAQLEAVIHGSAVTKNICSQWGIWKWFSKIRLCNAIGFFRGAICRIWKLTQHEAISRCPFVFAHFMYGYRHSIRLICLDFDASLCLSKDGKVQPRQHTVACCPTKHVPNIVIIILTITKTNIVNDYETKNNNATYMISRETIFEKLHGRHQSEQIHF